MAKTSSSKIKRHNAGFATLSELMIAGLATMIVVGGSALGLRTTGQLINKSGDVATLRQNTVNGQRLMRSEVERSIHLLVGSSEEFQESQKHLDLDDNRYSETIDSCKALAGNRGFNPVFGAKIVELVNPVIYGVSTSKSGNTYSIVRCGAPLQLDGSYSETEEIFLSDIIGNLGIIPCSAENCQSQSPLAATLEQADFRFTDGYTPYRSTYEPALRVETDATYKLVKFVDPTAADPSVDKIWASFLDKRKNERSFVRHNLHFAAFARADKQIDPDGDGLQGGVLSGAFFQNITSKQVRFVVDGSGSMSACVLWGEGRGSWKKYYDPRQGRYISTNRICALTRMKALQNELTFLLNELDDDTYIGLRSFSSSGFANHKTWDTYGTDLVKLGDTEVRESAIDFVNTLGRKSPTNWGGTDPWDAIKAAFDDPDTDALYFLSDGQPNRDRLGGYWSNNDEQATANYYSNLNTNREISMKVHTTALGIDSLWMQKLAEQTGGGYNQKDGTSLGG